jgi:hypothetical protein
MLMHLRNLLLVAALCWVAPASAGPADLLQTHPEGCPYAEQAREIVIAGDAGLGDVPVSSARRAFLP